MEAIMKALTLSSSIIALSAMLFAAPVLAASGSERDCDAIGGTYVKDGPESKCIGPEETKDVNGFAYGTATQDTTIGQGNTSNKETTTCDGNNGQCKQ
jgi:hypothetical protein